MPSAAEQQVSLPAAPLAEYRSMIPVSEPLAQGSHVGAEELALEPEVHVNHAPVHSEAPAAPAALRAPSVTAAPASTEQLRSVLMTAGLELVETDASKLESVRQRLSTAAHPVHAPRERKPLPPITTDALVQVETRKAH
jgi:ribonuclease E